MSLDNDLGFSTLQENDPELGHLIEKEKERQLRTLNLIASENYIDPAISYCLGSCLNNKYSEGQPGKRYYGGTEVIDEIERLCKSRCLEAFSLDSNVWSVNVQAYSGSPANIAAILAFLKPNDKILGLNLMHGGHLSHGYKTSEKKLSLSSIFFQTFSYDLDPVTELIDFDKLLEKAKEIKPQLIICGASSYPRFRDIIDQLSHRCLLLADIAHVSGLVAAGLHPSPFDYCDIVTTTVHKTLKGPRGALIFVNKKRLGSEAETQINETIFPILQGGPHNNSIGAIAYQMKQVSSTSWKQYAQTIIDNAKTLSDALLAENAKLITNGTDNHLILWNLKPYGITGSKLEKVAEACSIIVNKNTIPGDTSAISPSGVRIGTPAITSRGCLPHHMKYIAAFLIRCVQITVSIQKKSGKLLSSFLTHLDNDTDIAKLSHDVQWFLNSLHA